MALLIGSPRSIRAQIAAGRIEELSNLFGMHGPELGCRRWRRELGLVQLVIAAQQRNQRTRADLASLGLGIVESCHVDQRLDLMLRRDAEECARHPRWSSVRACGPVPVCRRRSAARLRPAARREWPSPCSRRSRSCAQLAIRSSPASVHTMNSCDCDAAHGAGVRLRPRRTSARSARKCCGRRRRASR